MATCKACGATIEWMETQSGKKMPVDPELIAVEIGSESPDTCVVTADGKAVWGKRYEDGPILGYVITGKVSHFATCPAADQFRKKG